MLHLNLRRIKTFCRSHKNKIIPTIYMAVAMVQLCRKLKQNLKIKKRNHIMTTEIY